MITADIKSENKNCSWSRFKIIVTEDVKGQYKKLWVQNLVNLSYNENVLDDIVGVL